MQHRPVIPAIGLRYRLCEVSAHRLDPRVLETHLATLSAANDEVTRTPEGLYVRSDLTPRDARRKSTGAAQILNDLDLTIEGGNRDQPTIALAAAASIRTALDSDGWHTLDPDAPSAGAAFLITRPKAAAPLLVTLIPDAEWLWPESQTLWAHTRAARELGAHPVFLARKVAPVTFALLAALNARALQFYDLLLSHDPDAKSREAAERLGLPKLRGASQLHEHRMYTQLHGFLTERPDERWAPALAEAFDHAIQQGFADESAPAEEVATWAGQHTDLPARWGQTVRNINQDGTGGVARPRTKAKRSEKTDQSPEQRGYGRKTEKTRVPTRIR